MPLLRDWRLRHPKDWQPQHMVDYLVDTRAALRLGIEPTVLCAGPAAACGILLTVMVDLVQANPECRDKVMEILGAKFELIEAVETRRVQ